MESFRTFSYVRKVFGNLRKMFVNLPNVFEPNLYRLGPILEFLNPVIWVTLVKLVRGSSSIAAATVAELRGILTGSPKVQPSTKVGNEPWTSWLAVEGVISYNYNPPLKFLSSFGNLKHIRNVTTLDKFAVLPINRFKFASYFLIVCV